MGIKNEQGDGIRLLTLDGGGPGSLSQLAVIGEYMSRLAHDKGVDVDSLFPADLFDMIGAVGYGAYIALLLGPLRMPVSQATEELVTLGTTLFPPGQTEMHTAEENSRRLKEAVEEMLKRQQLPVDIKLKDTRLPGLHCKVTIFVTQQTSSEHCIPFRTYASREQTFSCTLAEAACAALSTPPFFDPVPIGPLHRQRAYSSACIVSNNPTRELLREAEKQFGQDCRVSTILSIGCGRPPAISIDTLSSNLTDHYALLSRIVMDGEKVARELSSQLFNVDAYLRLNLDREMENSHTSDWSDLGAIEGYTDVYLRGIAVSKAVDSSLQTLQNKLGLINLGQLTRSTQVQTQAKSTPAVSPYFVVRGEYWEAMRRYLIISPEADRKIMVLSGMGGCGKTQMVAYFVRKYHSRYRYIFFVDATSHSSIQADLQSAIRALGAGHEQKSFEDAIKFLENNPSDGSWLVIFDNADDPTLNLIRYLPTCFHGTIIITTRNPGLGRLNTTTHLQLGPMDDIEAYETLVRAAHRTLPLSPDEDASGKELMKELGSLAVALVQAGSYCYTMSTSKSSSDAQYTFQQYLLLFKRYRKELMTKGDQNSLDQYTRGAYTTFNLSYSLLPQSARDLLHLSGFFHHTDISLSMLQCAAENNFSDWYEYLARPESHHAIEERLRILLCQDGLWDELSIHNTIHYLQSFSLVSTTSTSSMIFLRFHPLVHVWSRDILERSEEENYRKMAMQVVVSCTAPSNTTFYRFLRPHMTAFLEDRLLRRLHVNDQMGLGRVLKEIGEYSQAGTVFQVALTTMEAKFGRHDVETVRVAAWLAKLYHLQGRWKEAEKMEVEVLEQRRQLLSKDHPDTISAAANLASTYHQQGNWKEAEKMELEVLEQRQRLLTKDHLDTIRAAACLATTYYEQGKLNEAEKMQVEVLEQRQRLLTKDHPDTIRAAASLAATYYEQGRCNEAEKMEVDVLEQRQRLLSKDHPDTIRAAASLAATYCKQGKWKEAEKMEVKVLEQRQQLLSKDHPDTISAAANLAATYYEQGKWKEAEKIQIEVLEQQRSLLSSNHPETIESINNLAWNYHYQGRHAEAQELQNEAVEAAKRVLGDEHPDTITYIKSLDAIRHVRSAVTESRLVI